MADNEYIFAVARTRVLETRLLSDAFIGQLVAAPDLDHCRRLLSEKGWDENLTREEEKIWETVKELGIPMESFDVLTYPKLYHNLKAAIKEAATPERHPAAFYKDTDPDPERIVQLVQSKNFSSLPVHMRAVARDAYETFLHTQDGQLCDVMVDRACLEAIRDAGEAAEEQVVRDYAGTTVEITDMKIAARAAATGRSREFAEMALCPCNGINVKELAAAVQGGTEKVLAYLRKSARSEAADALESSPSAFDIWCDNEMVKAMKPQKMNPFSTGPVFAYVIGRQNEIKTVRIILTGKANGLSQDVIRERVRSMYG